MHAILILAAAALLAFAIYRRRTRRFRPRCPECHARLKYTGTGWQCPPCWDNYERARAAGRSRGTPGTYNFGR